MFSDSFDSIFFDGNDDLIKELVPFILRFLDICLNDELFLALMADESTSQPLSVGVDIIAEVEHDCSPDVIWGDHEVSVVDVGFEEGREEPIVASLSQLAALLITVELLHFIALPQRPSILISTPVFVLIMQLLNWNGLVPFEFFPDLDIGIVHCSSHILEFLKDLMQEVGIHNIKLFLLFALKHVKHL